MKRTISAMTGKGSVTHNSRMFTAENVDRERTHLNIDYCNEPIKKVYSDKLKINDSCIGCGLCSRICPMNNITIENNKAVAGNMCTMCYRCISHCPQKAITLIGKTVQEQCQYEKYIE